MDWHHSTVRRGCAGLVFNRVVAPWDGKPADAKAADDAQAVLIAALQVRPAANRALIYTVTGVFLGPKSMELNFGDQV